MEMENQCQSAALEEGLEGKVGRWETVNRALVRESSCQDVAEERGHLIEI